MAKSKKVILCLGMALVVLFSGVSVAAAADTIYVGNVGFNMDTMLNDDAYNAPPGTTMPQYAQQNPTTIPIGAVIWDGTGEPGGEPGGGGDFEVISID